MSADATYRATPEQTNVNYTWSFPSGFNIISSDNGTVIIRPSMVGSGEVVVTVSNICFTAPASTLAIHVSNVPEMPVITREACDRGLRYDGLDSDSIRWFKNNSILTETSVALQLSAADSGYYYIQVQNFCGTTTGEDIHVAPVFKEAIFMSNVVTANADGVNDFLVIDHTGEDFRLEIFNRWGRRVYESINYNNRWDGDGLLSGVYFYTLSNKCINSPIKGTIHLIK
jgi:hypothetical protein